MDTDIGILGASSAKGGVALWQFNVAVGNDNDDVEPSGEVDVIQSLGITSLPFPKDASGHAEGLGVRDCGGKPLVCIGGRDTRNAALVGKLKPGDTTLHSTGPGSVAQVFCKHEKKQCGLATDDVDKKSMLFLLDGKNKKAQLVARGAVIEIGEDGAITFTAKGGASLRLDDKVYVIGDLSLPGMMPGLALMQGPPIGDPSGIAPLFACLGVGK